MHPALEISKLGLSAQDTQMAVISNNLSNISTVGYKRDRANFQDALYQKVVQPGAATGAGTISPTGMMLGGGVEVVSTQKILEQGNLIQTDNPLDIAIAGNGYLQVQLPDGGIAYTRAGNLQLDDQGRLQTPNGYFIEPQISIPQPASVVNIAADGRVSVLEPGNTVPTEVGQLVLADFSNPPGLEAVGQNLFLETNASGAPRIEQPGTNGMGALRQGMLESSNVNAVDELVNMIQAQRSYELNAKAIETIDEMLEFAIQTL